MPTISSTLYQASRWVVGTALGFYFSRIERFHAEKVPSSGPVLFTSNHPNSLTDAFVIGASVHRKVSFVATVQLFRFAPLKWLLLRCGVIPVNRVKDDPRAMRSVLATFEACYRVLEQGEGVAIFPEGITHDDPQLKTVKTGAARMALELEQRHDGRLGLQIVPVGLSFSAKDRYRSEALVNFGEPIRVADWLPGFLENRHNGIQRLTDEIQRRIAALILHLAQIERGRFVEAVKRLYLERLKVANRVVHDPLPPGVNELILTQAIACAVDYTCEHHPERAERFSKRLRHYEHCLRRLNLSDAELAHFPEPFRLAARSAGWVLLGVVLLPVAAYGWLHRLAPYLVVQYAVNHFATKTARTQVSTATVLAGILSFSLFFGLYIAVFYAIFRWPAALWYGLTLPVASILAHYYANGVRRFLAAARCLYVTVRAPATTGHMVRLRAELVAEIEAARAEVPDDALDPVRKGTT